MIIICRNADFSANRIGTVTIKEVSSLAISGAASVTGMTTQLTATATFTDGTTSSVNPIWSISSGSQYASIDASGLLTIQQGAQQAQVVVSADYDGKTATKSITVTYEFSFELTVDVSDLNEDGPYHGVARSTQNDGTIANPNSNVYSCIIPCQSDASLSIEYDNLVVNNVTYYPRFKVFGFQEPKYSIGDPIVYTYARMTRNGSAGSYVFNGHIFDGFPDNAAKHIPDLPLVIPKAYSADGSARTENCPYLCVVVQFVDANNGTLSGNSAGTLASHAADVHLKYSIS